MLLRRSPEAAAMGGPDAGELRIDGPRVYRSDGWAVSVVETGALDVAALDPGRRAAVVGAFGQLCRGLDHPLQIVVQSRPWRADDVVTAASTTARDPRLERIGAGLRRAGDLHRGQALSEVATFRRTVLLAVAVHRPDGSGRSQLERAVGRVLATTTAAGIEARLLDGDALAERITDAWGDVEGCGRSDGMVRRPPWTAAVRHATSGSVMVRGVVLRRLPGVAVEPGWLQPLLTVRADCDVALHLRPVPVADAMSVLSRRLRDLRADQLVEIDRDRIGDAAVEVGLDSALELRGRLARNAGRSLRLSVVAVARGSSPAALDHAAAAVRLGFSTALMQCETTHLRHLEAAASTWPLADDRLGMDKLVDSAAAATCVPWVEAVCNDGDGYAMGRALDTATPVRLAPFDVSVHANANVAVFAASGHGKSYALGTLILEAAAHGVGSVVVDPEGEHRTLLRSLGGEYLTVAPGCGTAINVFDAGDLHDSAADRQAEVIAAAVDLVNVLCGGMLDQVERALVDAAATTAMRRAAAERRSPVLGDCLAELERTAPRVAVVVRRFTSGPLGDLFNRPTSVRLDSPVVGVCLRDLKDEFVPAATLVVAEWLWSTVRRDRRRRHLVFDEVGLLCAHPPLRTLLVQLARRCRKYQASLVVATQNAGDLLGSEEGMVIATNPAIVLLGGHRGAETARMRDAFSLTDEQRHLLECAGRGDFLLLAGSRRLPIHVEVSPLHHDLLTAQADRG